VTVVVKPKGGILVLLLELMSVLVLLTVVGSAGGGYISVYSPAALEVVSSAPLVEVTVTTLLRASAT
jgi:hypothetical protein